MIWVHERAIIVQERMLQSMLQYMGVNHPVPRERPQPTNEAAGRAMLPTKASQERTSGESMRLKPSLRLKHHQTLLIAMSSL